MYCSSFCVLVGPVSMAAGAFFEPGLLLLQTEFFVGSLRVYAVYSLLLSSMLRV